MDWAREYAPACPACREIYGQRNPPEVPPCENCRPEVIEGNEENFRIYQEVRGQIIAVGEQAVDINHLALEAAIRRRNVKDPDLCFDLVCHVFHHFLAKSREEQGG